MEEMDLTIGALGTGGCFPFGGCTGDQGGYSGDDSWLSRDVSFLLGERGI